MDSHYQCMDLTIEHIVDKNRQVENKINAQRQHGMQDNTLILKSGWRES